MLLKRTTVRLLYLVTSLFMPTSQSSLSSHGHLPRQLVATRLITSPSPRRLPLASLIHFFAFMSCVGPSRSRPSFSFGAQRLQCNSLTAPFNRLIPFSFKGPNAGSNFSRSQAPLLCAEAAQDIALRQTWVFPLGCKQRAVNITLLKKKKIPIVYKPEER